MICHCHVAGRGLFEHLPAITIFAVWKNPNSVFSLKPFRHGWRNHRAKEHDEEICQSYIMSNDRTDEIIHFCRYEQTPLSRLRLRFSG